MSSALNILSELIRQKNTGDDTYLSLLTFFFELEVPEDQAPLTTGNTFLYPLVVNPESYVLEEPFSLEATKGQQGSLYVEENGIVERTIKLSGTTGWAPRSFGGSSFMAPLVTRTPAERSFSRKLRTNLIPDAFGEVKLSGQKHFQYLQDAVFRIYGDLKRDPATAEKTKMYFHNPKDDEHWLVAPRSFRLTRQAGKRTLYYYDIELLILDKAESDKFTHEDSTLEKLLHTLEILGSAADLMQAAVNDLTSLVEDIERVVQGVASFIDNVTSIITAVKAFVNGVTDLIKSPIAVLNSIRDFVDTSMSIVADAEELKEAPASTRQAFQTFPDTVRQIFRQIGDAADTMGLHPQAFATPAQLQFEAILAQQSAVSVIGQANLDAAAAAPAPKNFDALAALGTGPLPGDAIRAQADQGSQLTTPTPKYSSAFEVDLGQGDTLANLAMRYLGDARLWKYIAVLNGLKPPFVNDQAAATINLNNFPQLSGVLGVGRKILIPSTAKPPQERTNVPILGVALTAPNDEQLLGVDLALEPIDDSGGGRPLYDIPIDKEHGSVDAKKVRGKLCLSQGCTIRLRTEQGTDILYPNLGVKRVVGSAGTQEKRAMAQFRVVEAVAQDPRIASVRNLEASPLTPITDLLDVTLEAEVRGFAQGQTIRTIA